MGITRAAIIGGGIVGLAVATEMMASSDRVHVTVFEKESGVARHQTGHNSGVVHAGLYYEPGSLKATLCRRGVELLRDYTARKRLPYNECGKIVVAQSDDDVVRLGAIRERANANGVPGIRLLQRHEIQTVEPHAQGISALHSPTTAIVDYPAVAEALAGDVIEQGGAVRLNQRVTGITTRGQEVVLSTPASTDAFDLVIACAGLQSDRVAKLSGDDAEPQIVPFFGDYFWLINTKESLVNGLIYPVPDPRYPFLGVHLTSHIDGRVSLGPNAFLSLGREAYSPSQWSAKDLAQAMAFPGFWRFSRKNVAAATREVRTVVSKSAFVKQAQKYVPEITAADVTRGTRGIRAQAMRADGSLEEDFVITGQGRMVHLRNAPSPAATSALAIAEHIVRTVIPTRLGLSFL